MSAKEFIDDIRAALETEGFRMKFNVGRDAIARVCYGMAFSPLIASEKAGDLDTPKIHEAGLEAFRARFGADKADLIRKVVTGRVST